MTRFDVLVEVTLRDGIADPEGTAMQRSLPALGVTDVHDIRVGKAIRLVVDADDEAAARAVVDDLCTRFFTNPVLQDATVTLEATAPNATAPT